MDQNSDDELHDELRRQTLAHAQRYDSQRYDSQTGLLNYHSFLEALEALLRGAEGQPSRQFALLWLDVLNLRTHFSLWGAKGAEALLRHVADSLRSVVDEDALVGSFGARCFLVAMRAAKSNREDMRRIQKVVDALMPMRTSALEFKAEVSAGVAFYPSDTDNAEDLMRFASLPAARAGYTMSPSVMTFHAGMNSLLLRHHHMEVEMEKGLSQGRFSTVYQPKIDLATGQVLGAEALTRWNHPVWGSVAPGEFIPVAERSRLIHLIFDFSLRAALKDAQCWRELGLSVPFISVNASAANIRREDFARFVRGVLEEIPVAPAELELEVTESVLFDDEELFAERVEQLLAIGVHIAIDDFGTRYTGFNVLRKLPLSAMKIDRCFIHGIHHSKEMQALCQTILAMARQLKLRTVAEGIEEPGELQLMREMGCDAGQGFLFQRPMPAEEFVAFLRDWPERMRAFGFADGRRRRPKKPKPTSGIQ